MGNFIKKVLKKQIVIFSVGMLALLIGAAVYIQIANRQFTGTTLSKIQNPKTKLACNQEKPSLRVSADEREQIGMVVASGIIDVPAGTNVDVTLSDYSKTSAKGTAAYSGKYGSYNFTIARGVNSKAKTYTDETKSFELKDVWKITDLKACRL